MTTPLNSNSIDSEGNLLVPLHGIRIAMALVLLPASAYWLFTFLGDREWHEHNPGTGASGVPDPLWMVILWVALLFVPFSISGLLLSRRSEEYKAAGAGLAAGLFACGLVFAIIAFLSEFLQFFPDPYFWENLIAILTFFVCSAWIVISAFRIAAKAGWGLFFLAGAATLVCLTWGSHSLKNAKYRLDRQNELRKAGAAFELFKPVGDAQHVLASLAGCLILNESVHPQAGYPASLDPPPADWPCQTRFAPNAVKEYTLSYAPQVDSAHAQVTDFRLIAVPVKKGVRGRYALMVDRRGIVFSDAMWGISSPYIKTANSEAKFAEVEALRGNIEHYVKENGLAAAPVTLNAEAVGTNYGLQVPSIEADGIHLEIKNYRFSYFASRTGNPSRFALSVHCQSYGENCLRSYFLDYDGTLHATGDPRQATANDPPALECEETDFQCKDVAWPDP